MKTIKIIMLTTLLLFLVACGSTSESTLQQNFKQGYGNLVISTIKDVPPDTVYSNSDFKIAVKLENQGAYDLTNGRIKILGFDKKYVEITENEKDIISLGDDIVLQGKNPFNPLGDYTFVEFEAKSKELFPGAESYNAYYYIKADYDYKTELIQTVCLNPKTYDIYDSGCKVEPKVSFNGQGSPLAITVMEEITHPGSISEVEFRFTLKNKGRGKVEKARLNQARLANKPLNCEFKNNPNQDPLTFIFKEEQEAVLICKKTLEDQNSYETSLFLDFSFTYSLKEKKKITLKK